MIAFSTECLWWDNAAFAKVVGAAIQCPFCGGHCEFHTDQESFLKMARRFELIGFTGHHDLMVWTQGRCFKTRQDAWLAYRTRQFVH